MKKCRIPRKYAFCVTLKGENRMVKILFVCHGNICRSPMAEFIMKDMVRKAEREDDFYIESAAVSTEEIGNDMHRGAKKQLYLMGVPYKRRAARKMTKADYSRFDLIILMDDYNVTLAERILGSDPDGKLCMLLDFTDRKGSSIADPWYTGNFEETYHDIVEGCQAILEKY